MQQVIKQQVINLDKKDKKILIELEKDARQSNKQIAKKVGVHADLVRYRINRLEQNGVIGWFLTFVNFSKIGYTDYGIYIITQKLTKEIEKELIGYLMK
jgi:DNA-binding Lrp family transcriptional regulator